MCLNSKKPEQDFLLGTKSKRIWMEGILQGFTAQTGRLWQGRHSWPQAEQSLAGAVRHCQTGEGREQGLPSPLCPGAAESSRSHLDREKCCALCGMYHPIHMRMLMALLVSAHSFQRGSEKAQHQRGMGLSSCLSSLCRGRCQQAPTPAKTGFQAVVLSSGLQQATGHSSFFFFVLLTTLTLPCPFLATKLHNY